MAGTARENSTARANRVMISFFILVLPFIIGFCGDTFKLKNTRHKVKQAVDIVHKIEINGCFFYMFLTITKLSVVKSGI